MKRIKNIVAVLTALILGTSFAIADGAQYEKFLAEGKAYEEKGLYVHAMGAYWDAIGTNLGDAEEAQKNLERIYKAFRETNNPGPGKYDDFSRYDGWLEVCKDFEIYWNEHPGEIFTTSMKCKKEAVDMKSRTATYTFSLYSDYSPKFNYIGDNISFAFRKAYRKYGSDWSDIPQQWPAVSIFKDSKTIPVVKFIKAFYKNDGPYYNLDTYLTLSKYSVTPFHLGDTYGGTPTKVNTLSFLDGKSTEAYMAAWNNYNRISNNILGIPGQGIAEPVTNMSIKFTIKDMNGKTIVSMNKEEPFVIDTSYYKTGSPFKLSGISATDIESLDSGKWTYSIDSFSLTPREVTATALRASGFGGEADFTNVQYKSVSPTIDYLKGNAGFASIDILKENKEATEKNKSAKASIDLPQLILNENGEFDLLYGYCTEYIMKYAIPEGYRLTIYKEPIYGEISTVITWDSAKKDEYLFQEDLSKLINELAGTNYEYRFSDARNYNEFIYRNLSDDELLLLKKQLVKEGDLAKVNKWFEKAIESQKSLAREIYNYIRAKKYVADGTLHTNLLELEIADNKGASTIKKLSPELKNVDLQKNDVITHISVIDFFGDKKIIQVSELKDVLAPATCVFTVQRGSGKKAQTIDVTIPVEWNRSEALKCSLRL